ncbi:4Fe-4S dicluster domain-containing protein [Rosettibacter firmus]|uniref:4Fe-4S dicluster domain-containing protein n=1 Tax=Rosettibacter firmus TaxID=3111522 RepID=UPI00336BCFF6
MIDFTEQIPPAFTKYVLYFQFIPSLLKSLAAFTILSTGFLLVLLLTALFGRIYCSTICPLGFLQDIINYITKKIKKRKRRFEYLKEQKILRWSFLAFCVVLFLFGFAIGINLLDPYSIYGRIAGNIFRPTVIGLNNFISSILTNFKIYSLYPYEIKSFNLIPFLITISFLILIAYLSVKKGRLYCNTVCPVGTLLGYISKYSFFKIIIKDEECLSCGLCERDCKANCIDSDSKIVDMSRCVMCFDCISLCPTNGITFDYKKSIKTPEPELVEVDESKRNFLISTGVYLTSLSTILAQVKKQIVVTKPSTVPIFRKYAISPPGSQSIKRFNSICTACHLCVSSCPTQVLQPSFLEYGFTGMLQPRLNNKSGYCNFDCNICSEVCPTGAILPIDIEKKKLTQLGVAKFIKENCIVYTQRTECGACSEHCPTKAVHMIPFENNLVIPEVREEYCIGCGACEYACPVKPYKAIYVEGNPIHKTAKKNIEEEKPQQKVDYKEEFPF